MTRIHSVTPAPSLSLSQRVSALAMATLCSLTAFAGAASVALPSGDEPVAQLQLAHGDTAPLQTITITGKRSAIG